jgi:hypothetical protein
MVGQDWTRGTLHNGPVLGVGKPLTTEVARRRAIRHGPCASSQLCMISLNLANQSFWCSTRIGVGIDSSRAKSSSLVG